MKTRPLFIALFTFIFLFAGNVAFAQKDDSTKKKKNVETLQLKVTGMTCAEGCAKGIESAVYRIKGVKSSSVNFDTQVASIVYDPTKTNKEDIIKTIEAFNPGEASHTKYQVEEINAGNKNP